MRKEVGFGALSELYAGLVEIRDWRMDLIVAELQI